MNPPNPFIQPDDNQKPEQKFRGLIIAGNVIAIIIIVLIILVAGYTIRKSSLSRIEEEMRHDIDMMDQPVADAAVDVGDTYSNSSAEYQEGLNDDEALKLRLLISDTASNRAEMISTISSIQTRTDEICSEIRLLANEFTDSTANAYSYNEEAVTNHFFITAGRAAILLMKIHDYRQNVIGDISKINPTGVYQLEQSLPLDDAATNDYTVGWDNSKLQGSCYDALEFLKSMETEIRNFESASFNRLPRTY